MNAPNSFDFSPSPTGARAAVVNRTRRVVREQALRMREQKQLSRSLWLPVTICSTLLLTIGYALWATLDGYDFVPSGTSDASEQFMLFLLFSLPATFLVLGLVWFQRTRAQNNGEV